MLIKEIMTDHPEYLPTDTTLTEAARCMRDLDCGFLPLGNGEDEKLQGVVTDRDITIRAVAEGMDPNSTIVGEIKTDKVLYCFADDDVADVVHNMEDEQVYRLVVLNNSEDKKLCGIVSLGDVLRKCDDVMLAGNAARGIMRTAA